MLSNSIATEEASLECTVTPINVVLTNSRIYSPEESSTPSEHIESFILSLPLYNGCGVPLRELVESVAANAQNNINDCQILYKTAKESLYTLAGVFPHQIMNQFVSLESPDEVVYVKCRISCTAVPTMPEKDEREEKLKIRRGNERRICDVLDALVTWKRLVTLGKVNSKGVRVKCTKREAAELVEIPKKTLADYSAQIKIASAFNFDFQMHNKEKFGVVREFNRRMSSRCNK
eukprot:TRINITY_DN1058_c0_g1_i10.p1 TRINITY_DN1058_c0_g1~~TRINITY_DN1058_c0_g1_i10.p1  ORF type:complete len:233 (-),score=36.95 TRINITY_DN1058_c0_g1_i10:121-819(-)